MAVNGKNHATEEWNFKNADFQQLQGKSEGSLKHSLPLNKPRPLTNPRGTWQIGNLTQTSRFVTGGCALPRMGDSSTHRVLQTPSIPLTGVHLGSKNHPAISLPLQPWAGDELSFQLFTGARKRNWGPATGTLMHMDGLSHKCWPQWNKQIIPVLQAKHRQMPAGPGAGGFAHFPAAKGQMSSLEGSAGPSFCWPRAVSSGEDVARSCGAVPPWQQRKCDTPSEPRNE